MAISKLKLNQKYKTQVLGWGEIYEIISVEKKKILLKKRFKQGVLFLVSNKDHSNQGLKLKKLEEKISRQGYRILAKGFVDSPPWPSVLRQSRKNSFLNLPWLKLMIANLFKVLVLFEFLWQGKKKSHMIYVLGRKEK